MTVRESLRLGACVAALVPVLSAAPASAQTGGTTPLDPAVTRAVESITEADVMRRVGILAHDSMRGRDTPSPELEAAAAWIASEFEGMGFAPGGDGDSYLQRFEILQMGADFQSSALRAGGTELRFGDDLAAPQGLNDDADLTGEMILLRGSEGFSDRIDTMNLRGRHVLLVSQGGGLGAQAIPVRQMVTGLRRAGVLSILVASDRATRDWTPEVERQASAVRTVIPWGADRGPQAPLIEIRDGAADRLIQGSGTTVAAARQAVEGPFEAVAVGRQPVTLVTRRRVVSESSAPNVVGILEGSDPTLRGEYVVLSAHMDHVGVGRPDEAGDSIYNGADDNASGTTTIMEIAEAFSMLETRPRRSIMVVAVSGEEKGLWGSDYFAGNPPVPGDAMVANFNLDMVGRNWPDTIVAIGKEHSDLGATLNEVNARHPELGMTAIDDLWPEQNFYFRSDHYNFARRGVPVLFFFNGVHPDYHRPSDSPDLIDGEKAARIGRLVFLLSLEVANRTERPRWNPDSYAEIVTEQPGN